MTNSIRIHAGLLADTAGCVTNARPRVKVDLTHPRFDTPADADQRTTALAAALYIAQYGYKLAAASPDPAARLDDMCDAIAETWDAIAPKLPEKFAGADLEFAETMRAAVADRLWAFTAVEYARAEAGDGYSYLFDYLAGALQQGADPHIIRRDALAAPARIRELAEQAGDSE
jgi:hypothetical protein